MMNSLAEQATGAMKQRIGHDSEPGEWFAVTQEIVNGFAGVTDDHQWIHLDVERAKDSPFGGTIAHGFLTLSLIISLQSSIPSEGPTVPVPIKMAVNYGLNRVRFPAPVLVGSRVRATRKLVAVDIVSDDCVQTTNEVTVHVDGLERPACVAEMLGRFYL